MTVINEVLALLASIEADATVPKNVRVKLKSVILSLEENANPKSVAVLFDKVMQELDELSDDPNLPSYTRTQIWNVVSTLERK